MSSKWARTRGHAIKVTPENLKPIPATAYPTPATRPLNSRLSTLKLREAFGLTIPLWQIGVDRMLAEVLGLTRPLTLLMTQRRKMSPARGLEPHDAGIQNHIDHAEAQQEKRLPSAAFPEQHRRHDRHRAQHPEVWGGSENCGVCACEGLRCPRPSASVRLNTSECRWMPSGMLGNRPRTTTRR